MSPPLPVISVVTPSRNAERFLERTLESVAAQEYPHLEHVLVDGGSTDGTMAIVERHRHRLAHVESGPDGGMYDALNRGFARTGGEVMTWLNADDVWFPGTLRTVGMIFARFPEVEWITTEFPAAIDAEGRPIAMDRIRGYCPHAFLRGEFLPAAGWPAAGFIQQESTFWRRSLWERAGARCDASLTAAGDFELWSRFFRHAELWCVSVPLGCFRKHPDQKTARSFAIYLEEARRVFAAAGGKVPHHAIAGLRVGLRRHAPPGLMRNLIRVGWMEPRPWIVYDWGRDVWVVDRR
jgi:glycosyltransferase involved in cell wall biosynthesis